MSLFVEGLGMLMGESSRGVKVRLGGLPTDAAARAREGVGAKQTAVAWEC